MHPIEREQLQAESTLVVTVDPSRDGHEDGTDGLDVREQEDREWSSPTLTFTSYDDLMATLTPRTLELIETVRREEPASINETARIVDRDVKNVHEELSRLARLGIIFFEAEGQRKRPIVWFDELVITLPFDGVADESNAIVP